MGTVFNTDKKIRLGIWGLGRGRAFIECCKSLNIEIVAGCDFSETMRDDFRKLCPDAMITADEDEFLACDMDVVLVATYFFAHAKNSIKALNAGKHVLSEVSAFFTPAEGVELVEAVEKSGKMYCLAENYTDQFVKQLWKEGVFGELAYGEIDYVHECRGLCYSTLYGDPLLPGNVAHSWRSWLNFHYYCTHSLGAAMEMTGTRPVKVCAPPSTKNLPGYLPGSEMGAMEPSFVTMDNGGIIRNLMGASTRDSHRRRLWGTRAFVDCTNPEIEIALGQKGRGPLMPCVRPKTELTELAEKAGHAGGDFWVLYNFANAYFNGAELYWDIYKACDVTLTGIMAVKSQQNGGVPMDVPDFRKKAVRDQYRNDDFAQQHFDPKKIFPDNQNIAETKYFSYIATELDSAWKNNGISLIIAVLDGIKLYKYVKDEKSRLEFQAKVRELLRNMQPITVAMDNAKALIAKYPGSPAAIALQEYIDSAYPEKMADIPALRNELMGWLASADLPERRQLIMSYTAEQMAQVQLLPVPDGFTLRTYQDGDDEAYVELMRSAGFSYWNLPYLQTVKKAMLDNATFFIVENATGRLVATTMANKIPETETENAVELGWVAVNPDFRGKHFSEITHNAAVHYMHEHGYAKAYLHTDDFRIPAIKTYLKAGWKPELALPGMKERWDAVMKRVY